MQSMANKRNSSKNYCEVAAVSPNKNPSQNKGEQNVSFDRSTPGPVALLEILRGCLSTLSFRLLHNAHFLGHSTEKSQTSETTDCIEC